MLESTTVGLTVLDRGQPDELWRTITLTNEEVLRMPEIGIAIPLAEFYVGIEFAGEGEVIA
jgi:hypothetical protein